MPFDTVSCREEWAFVPAWPHCLDAPADSTLSVQFALTTVPSFPPQLNFDLDRGVFPVVIQAMVDEGDGEWHLPLNTPSRPEDLPTPSIRGGGLFSPETAPTWLSRLRVPGAPLPMGGDDPAPPRVEPRADRLAALESTPRGSCEGRQHLDLADCCLLLLWAWGPQWAGLRVQAASWGSTVWREEAQGWDWGGGGLL